MFCLLIDGLLNMMNGNIVIAVVAVIVVIQCTIFFFKQVTYAGVKIFE